MSTPLGPKERILRTIAGEPTDHIPTIGGWMNGVRNMADLAGISVQQYLAEPLAGVVAANRALGVDAMVVPVVPRRLEEIRSGYVSEADHPGVEPEALLQAADRIPGNDEGILRSFDAAAEEARYRAHFDTVAARWQGVEPIPNFWEIGGHFPLYTEYGYNAFLSACALYPEAVGRLWYAKSLHSRQRAHILAKLFKELDLVKLMFCGEDVCNNSGPMVSPAFLRKHYFPTVRMIMEPLLDIGVRFIHHCDGDVRPVLQDFLDLGFSGFQGFQYELGVDLFDMSRRRSAKGEPLLFFAGMSVTRTMPFGTPDDVRAEVDYLVDATGGGQGMFLFTSNVTGVEVPPENIRTAYHYAASIQPSPRRTAPRPWPWAVSHPF